MGEKKRGGGGKGRAEFENPSIDNLERDLQLSWPWYLSLRKEGGKGREGEEGDGGSHGVCMCAVLHYLTISCCISPPLGAWIFDKGRGAFIYCYEQPSILSCCQAPGAKNSSSVMIKAQNKLESFWKSNSGSPFSLSLPLSLRGRDKSGWFHSIIKSHPL